MDRFQQMIVARAILEGKWQNTRYDERRLMSAAELDAVADFTWPWCDLKRVVASCTNAVRSLWRSRPSVRPEDSSVVSAEA